MTSYSLLREISWLGSPVAAPRGLPRFCQAKLTGSPEEPGALPGGVRAEKGGEIEAELSVGLKTLLFRFLKLTAAKASPLCLIPLAEGVG